MQNAKIHATSNKRHVTRKKILVTSYLSPVTSKGFSLIEFIVTMIIVASLLGLVVINLFNARQRATVNTSITQLISDIKNQQIQAMVGDTEGRGTNSTYGVHFDTSTSPQQYILYHGTYNPSDATNLTVKLDDTVVFSSITFPSSEINFSPVSGDISGFVSGQNTITVQETASGSTKTITINKYGVVLQD